MPLWHTWRRSDSPIRIVAQDNNPSSNSLYLLAAPDFSTDEVVIHAGSLLKTSGHALEGPVCAYADTHRISLLPAAHVEAQERGGWTGRVNGKICVLGDQRLMDNAHIDTGALEAQGLTLSEQGKEIYFLSIGDHLAGLLAVRKPDS